MHARRPLALLLTLAFALAGCGGGDDDAGSNGGQAEKTPSQSCVDQWNDKADDTLVRIVNLANDPESDVLVGTYKGEPFEAEAFDGSTTGTGTQVAVNEGDCVVTQVSGDGLVLFSFVLPKSGGDSWHRLNESGDHPLGQDLAKNVDAHLAGVVRTTRTGEGVDATLEPKGTS